MRKKYGKSTNKNNKKEGKQGLKLVKNMERQCSVCNLVIQKYKQEQIMFFHKQCKSYMCYWCLYQNYSNYYVYQNDSSSSNIEQSYRGNQPYNKTTQQPQQHHKRLGIFNNLSSLSPITMNCCKKAYPQQAFKQMQAFILQACPIDGNPCRSKQKHYCNKNIQIGRQCLENLLNHNPKSQQQQQLLLFIKANVQTKCSSCEYFKIDLISQDQEKKQRQMKFVCKQCVKINQQYLKQLSQIKLKSNEVRGQIYQVQMKKHNQFPQFQGNIKQENNRANPTHNNIIPHYQEIISIKQQQHRNNSNKCFDCSNNNNKQQIQIKKIKQQQQFIQYKDQNKYYCYFCLYLKWKSIQKQFSIYKKDINKFKENKLNFQIIFIQRCIYCGIVHKENSTVYLFQDRTNSKTDKIFVCLCQECFNTCREQSFKQQQQNQNNQRNQNRLLQYLIKTQQNMLDYFHQIGVQQFKQLVQSKIYSEQVNVYQQSTKRTNAYGYTYKSFNLRKANQNSFNKLQVKNQQHQTKHQAKPQFKGYEKANSLKKTQINKPQQSQHNKLNVKKIKQTQFKTYKFQRKPQNRRKTNKNSRQIYQNDNAKSQQSQQSTNFDQLTQSSEIKPQYKQYQQRQFKNLNFNKKNQINNQSISFQAGQQLQIKGIPQETKRQKKKYNYLLYAEKIECQQKDQSKNQYLRKSIKSRSKQSAYQQVNHHKQIKNQKYRISKCQSIKNYSKQSKNLEPQNEINNFQPKTPQILKKTSNKLKAVSHGYTTKHELEKQVKKQAQDNKNKIKNKKQTTIQIKNKKQTTIQIKNKQKKQTRQLYQQQNHQQQQQQNQQQQNQQQQNQQHYRQQHRQQYLQHNQQQHQYQPYYKQKTNINNNIIIDYNQKIQQQNKLRFNENIIKDQQNNKVLLQQQNYNSNINSITNKSINNRQQSIQLQQNIEIKTKQVQRQQTKHQLKAYQQEKQQKQQQQEQEQVNKIQDINYPKKGKKIEKINNIYQQLSQIIKQVIIDINSNSSCQKIKFNINEILLMDRENQCEDQYNRRRKNSWSDSDQQWNSYFNSNSNSKHQLSNCANNYSDQEIYQRKQLNQRNYGDYGNKESRENQRNKVQSQSYRKQKGQTKIQDKLLIVERQLKLGQKQQQPQPQPKKCQNKRCNNSQQLLMLGIYCNQCFLQYLTGIEVIQQEVRVKYQKYQQLYQGLTNQINSWDRDDVWSDDNEEEEK